MLCVMVPYETGAVRYDVVTLPAWAYTSVPPRIAVTNTSDARTLRLRRFLGRFLSRNKAQPGSCRMLGERWGSAHRSLRSISVSRESRCAPAGRDLRSLSTAGAYQRYQRPPPEPLNTNPKSQRTSPISSRIQRMCMDAD